MKCEPKKFPKKLREKLSQKAIGKKNASTLAKFAIIDFQAKTVFTYNKNKPHLHSLIGIFSITTIMSHKNDAGSGLSATRETRSRSRGILRISRNPTVQSQLA